MNEIQIRIMDFLKLERKSINQCLMVLGAEWGDVYYGANDRRLKQPCDASNRTIYRNYERAELFDWAEHLYFESLKKYHPDKHPENVRLYTEICQELSKAFLRAKKILNGGSKCATR